METLDSPLVLTKIRRPVPRTRMVTRPRLVARLTAPNGAGLVLLSAPAGYGKSTLLAEWAQSAQPQDGAIAWYALDPADDEPATFGAYLVASLQQALGPSPELTRLAQRLRASPDIDLQQILSSVINALVSQGSPCTLILDDVHLITANVIHAALAFLLGHLPANLRLVASSRADPPWPLARLRARGQLLELRAQDLRFTVDEARDFLNAWQHLDLTPTAVETLTARTEGWVAGLQLAALSLAEHSDKDRYVASFAGSQRHLADFLLEEVFSRLADDVQRFLMATSILERLSAPLCDALLGPGSNSAAILAQLSQANLFLVALDDQDEWFRYHHLFRDFLRSRLEKSQPESLTALHQAASAWLAEHHNLREAARHAFQTRDWEVAAAFVERHSFTLIIHSEIATLYEWCTAFPEDVLHVHPLLCILQCWGLVFSFRRQNQPHIEARLLQAEQAAANLSDRHLADELCEHAAAVRTFLAMVPGPVVDARKQIALAEQRLEAYPDADAGQFSALLTISYARAALLEVEAAISVAQTARAIALRGQLFFGVVESTFHLARLAHAQGRLSHAANLCHQGRSDIAALLAEPERELPALGCLEIALGCVRLDQDRLDEAEALLRHGLDLIGPGMNPHYLLTALIALARVTEIQGRLPEADGFLAGLEEAWPDVAFCTDGLRVRMALHAAPEAPQTRAAAEAWSRRFSDLLLEGSIAPGLGPLGATEAFYQAQLAWIQAQIALGRAPVVWPVLEKQLAPAIAHGLAHRVIELSLLEALVARAVGDLSRGWVALERALAVARPEAPVRCFDQAPAVPRLLTDALCHGLGRGQIEPILAALARPRAEVVLVEPPMTVGSVGPAENIEPLSERELEVLRLMANGATNRAIAERLIITVGTVKSHVNHILGKLGAHNRTEAVARARRLGLA